MRKLKNEKIGFARGMKPAAIFSATNTTGISTFHKAYNDFFNALKHLKD